MKTFISNLCLNREPIYEDDALSVASYSSTRSTNRHPEHSTIKQQKMMERNSALQNEDIYAPLSEPIYHIGLPAPHPGLPNMPLPFYPGFMPPFHDPRIPYPIHPQMMARDESFTRGRPMLPPNYNESQRDTRIEVPPPIYNDYHQGRLPQPPTHPSQDDINIHKQQSNSAPDNVSLKHSTSMGNLSAIGEASSAETRLAPTQSMAALPVSSQSFPRPSGGMRQRSHSFTM